MVHGDLLILYWNMIYTPFLHIVYVYKISRSPWAIKQKIPLLNPGPHQFFPSGSVKFVQAVKTRLLNVKGNWHGFLTLDPSSITEQLESGEPLGWGSPQDSVANIRMKARLWNGNHILMCLVGTFQLDSDKNFCYKLFQLLMRWFCFWWSCEDWSAQNSLRLGEKIYNSTFRSLFWKLGTIRFLDNVSRWQQQHFIPDASGYFRHAKQILAKMQQWEQ